MARRTTTRDRLVATAGELFWRQGYAGTGVSEIIARAHATSGSFYHFFTTKDELLVAVVESVADKVEREVLGPAETAAKEPIGRLDVVIDAYRSAAVARESAGYGLPIGALVNELGHGNERVRRAMAELYGRLVGRIAGWLGDASPATSEVIVAALEGASTMAVARRSSEPVDRCAVELRRMLASAVDAGGGPDEGWRPGPATATTSADWKAW